ncbi:MAG: archaeal proteinsorting signal/PGF-pre-PGF domain [Fibrobacteres bacterium]|nr:archaeal proteinsorting signal/PGF-pre-PGF domain [Fibrobacterota bacterium]
MKAIPLKARIRFFASAAVVAAAMLLASCLEDHPLVGPANITDPNIILAADTTLKHLDSVEITLVDKYDSTRIIEVWRGRIDAGTKLPVHVGGEGEKFLVVVHAYAGSPGACFVEIFEDGMRIRINNGCWDTTVVLAGPPRILSMVARPETAGVGETITFSASASIKVGTGLRYYWDFDRNGIADQGGNASPGLIFTGSHGFSKPGNYLVTLVVLDDSDQTATDSLFVEVLADPGIADAGMDTSVAGGTSFLLQGRVIASQGSTMRQGWVAENDTIPDGVQPYLWVKAPNVDTVLFFIYRAARSDDLLLSDTVSVTVFKSL